MNACLASYYYHTIFLSYIDGLSPWHSFQLVCVGYVQYSVAGILEVGRIILDLKTCDTMIGSPFRFKQLSRTLIDSFNDGWHWPKLLL